MAAAGFLKFRYTWRKTSVLRRVIFLLSCEEAKQYVSIEVCLVVIFFCVPILVDFRVIKIDNLKRKRPPVRC